VRYGSPLPEKQGIISFFPVSLRLTGIFWKKTFFRKIFENGYGIFFTVEKN
jgi:hypothetical protein